MPGLLRVGRRLWLRVRKRAHRVPAVRRRYNRREQVRRLVVSDLSGSARNGITDDVRDATRVRQPVGSLRQSGQQLFRRREHNEHRSARDELLIQANSRQQRSHRLLSALVYVARQKQEEYA